MYMNVSLHWNRLLTTCRLGLEQYHSTNNNERRGEFERDYDRLVFSSPFRRLQNKTQVFPLPGSVFVHNRLTHSFEVACVGRSLANNVMRGIRERYGESCELLDEIGSIVSAACLAHDMGNPPFGHAGERAIGAFFAEGNGNAIISQLPNEQRSDFMYFDGNANAFRLLTHQFNGRRPGGFVQTYSMLAAIVKYPYDSSHATREKQKFGFFKADESTYRTIADKLGISDVEHVAGHAVRHPLVYLVEAADDICYQLMDIEDAHKLGILTTAETLDLLLEFQPEERHEHVRQVLNMVQDDNEKVSYLRSTAVGVLVDACTEAFLNHYHEIMAGDLVQALIKMTDDRVRETYKRCSRLAVKRIYHAPEVLDIELSGYRIISTLMDTYVTAVQTPNATYSEQLLARVPDQYQVYDNDLYTRLLAVVDYVSGMTDVYALDLYRKIMGISITNS